jgi:transcriptional regulator with XRE-family HTH domain
VSREPLPEPWRSALESKGIESKRGLAGRVGISPQTAKRLIDGIGSPSAETVARVADALFGGDRARVWALAGIAREDHGDWVLPPEASQLDPEQRAAVLAVVRAMLPPGVRRAERAGGADAAPLTKRERSQQLQTRAARKGDGEAT